MPNEQKNLANKLSILANIAHITKKLDRYLDETDESNPSLGIKELPEYKELNEALKNYQIKLADKFDVIVRIPLSDL
jgi:hypothetical protein